MAAHGIRNHRPHAAFRVHASEGEARQMANEALPLMILSFVTAFGLRLERRSVDPGSRFYR
jgi:hypothetical protein